MLKYSPEKACSTVVHSQNRIWSADAISPPDPNKQTERRRKHVTSARRTTPQRSALCSIGPAGWPGELAGARPPGNTARCSLAPSGNAAPLFPLYRFGNMFVLQLRHVWQRRFVALSHYRTDVAASRLYYTPTQKYLCLASCPRRNASASPIFNRRAFLIELNRSCTVHLLTENRTVRFTQ